MRALRPAVLLLALVVETPSRLGAQAPRTDSITARVDRIFAQWDRKDSPGCALSVIRDGKLAYTRGYGMADLEHDIPITPSSVFYVGSDSKQFTAMAIALLAKDGKLSLDDDIRRYVPEVPDYGERITIRHLIHHTSGLRDYLTLRGLAGYPPDGVFGDDEVLAMIARQRDLNFAPGAEHLYSNSGYFLLSLIVERVSGKSLRLFADERIFKPLGMPRAHFHDDHAELVKNRAWAYAPRAGGYRLSMPNFDVVGAGGLNLPVEEFLAWDREFYEGKLGGRDLITQTITPGKLNDGTVLSYAFGLNVGQYRGLRTVSHGGSYGGYRAEILRFPDQRFSVATFCNLSSIATAPLARQVADAYLAAELRPATTRPAPGSEAAETPPPRAVTPVVVPPSRLGELVGHYHSEELGVIYRIALDGGRLVVTGGGPARALVPQATDRYSSGGQTFRFLRDTRGRLTGFALDAGRVRNVVFVRR
jgi:CubicO group peptidase (beta-lactamase class C family)